MRLDLCFLNVALIGFWKEQMGEEEVDNAVSGAEMIII